MVRSSEPTPETSNVPESPDVVVAMLIDPPARDTVPPFRICNESDPLPAVACPTPIPVPLADSVSSPPDTMSVPVAPLV